MTESDSTGAGRRLLILSVANFVLLAAITVIFPLLAELQAEHGLSTAELGLMSGASFIAGLVAQLGLARYVDRGHARSMLVGAVVLVAASLFAIAAASELWQFVTARFIEGLGYAMFAPAARAVVAAGDPTRVGRNLGRLSAAELGGLVVGPLIGAFLFEVGGTSLPFVTLAVTALVLVVPMATMDLGSLGHGARVDTQRRPTSTRDLWRRPPVRRAAILYLALFLPTGVYDVLWARYLTDLGAGPTFVGVSFAIYGIPYVIVAPLGGRLVDRVGAIPVTVWGLVATLPFILAYGLFSIPLVVAAFAIGEAAANAVSIPAAQAAMVDACEPREIGIGQGLSGAMGIGGAGISALVAAPIYARFGAETTFVALCVVMVALALVAWRAGLSPKEPLTPRYPTSPAAECG